MQLLQIVKASGQAHHPLEVNLLQRLGIIHSVKSSTVTLLMWEYAAKTDL
jgi:hypothetical protein